MSELRELRVAKKKAKRHLYRVWHLWQAEGGGTFGWSRLLPPDPPPRTDDVFEAGVLALDGEAADGRRRGAG